MKNRVRLDLTQLINKISDEHISFEPVTVDDVIPPKNAMFPMGFDPETSRIESYHSTNRARKDLQKRS